MRAEEDRLDREIEEVQVLIQQHHSRDSSRLLASPRGILSRRPSRSAPPPPPVSGGEEPLLSIEFPSSPDLFDEISSQPLHPLADPPATIDDDSAGGETTGRVVFTTSLVRPGAPSQLIRRFGETFADLVTAQDGFGAKVTHLILPTTDGRIAKRTQKYLLAMLNGLWIVTLGWVEECLRRGRLVREAPFEVAGDENYPEEEAPRCARLSRRSREAPLLCGYAFYLYGAFATPNQPDLAQLIRAAGGTVIDNVRELLAPRRTKGARVIILCDPREQADFEKDAGVIQKFRPLLTSTWLLDCISSFQIVDSIHYIVL